MNGSEIDNAKPASHEAEALAAWWAPVGFDYFATASLKEAVYDKYGLGTPSSMLSFARKRLDAARYRGPYVIVAHDNGGSALYHPHLLLVGSDAGEKVRREFFRFADVPSKGCVPFEGMGPINYCANRACDGGYDSNLFVFEAKGDRRIHPRSRSSKAKKKGTSATYGPSRATTKR